MPDVALPQGPGPRPGVRRWAWWGSWAAVVVGLVGAAAVVAEVGPARLRAQLVGAWPAVLAGLGLELAAVLLRARALQVLLRPADAQVSFRRVVVAQAAGGAMCDVTPTGLIGDTTRLAALAGRAPTATAVSAIVAYDLGALGVEALLLAAGATAAAMLGGLAPTLTLALWLVAGLGAAALALARWAMRRGLARTTLAALARVRAVSPARRARWSARAAEVDRALRERQTRPPLEALHAGALITGARLLNLAELVVATHAAGHHLDGTQLAGLALGALAVSRLSGLTPLGLGTRDAGTAGLFVLLGLPAAGGAAVVLLIRIRQLVTTALALGALAALQAADRPR